MVEIVREIIKEKLYLYEKEDGTYEGEIHGDYNDKLSDDQIENIVESEDMMEAFYDVLSDYASDCQMVDQDHVLNTIYDNWDDEEHGHYENYEEEIRDFVIEKVFFNFPYDHFLKQDIRVNVMVDTGDGNYDYTLNSFLGAYGDGETEEEASILWLVQQQGYSTDALEEAIKEEQGNRFLDSVVDELQNVSSTMNALTFFVSMTLEDLIELKEKKKGLVLSQYTPCGLYDPWNGAGSLLDIQLDQDVVIPANIIEPDIDGARGYSVQSIWGMGGDFWTDQVKGIL